MRRTIRSWLLAVPGNDTTPFFDLYANEPRMRKDGTPYKGQTFAEVDENIVDVLLNNVDLSTIEVGRVFPVEVTVEKTGVEDGQA